MKLRCQQTILGNQCKHSVYKNEMYCRWHKILREFRRDNQRLPEHTHIFASGYMYTAGISIFGFLFCLSLFDTTNNVLWVLAAFLSLAWSFVYASDGIMARGEDYPLSLFAFWPKLLTAGMSLGVLMSVLLLIDVMVIPSHAALLTQQMTNSHLFDSFAIYLVVFGLAFFILTYGRLLSNRILFLNDASFVNSDVTSKTIKPAPLDKRDSLLPDYIIFQQYRDDFIAHCQRKDSAKRDAFKCRIDGRLRGEVLDFYFDNRGYLFELEVDEETVRKAIILSEEVPIYIIAFYASTYWVETIKRIPKVNVYRLADMGRTSASLTSGSEFETYTLTIPQMLRNM